MALKDTALTIVLKAKDLTKGVLGKFKRNINEADKAAEKTAGGGMAKLAKSIGGVVAAAIGFAAIKTAFLSVLQTGDKFEKLGIQLATLTGSVENGEKAFAWVREFTKETPLQLADTTKAFVQLKAFGIDPMNGSLQAVVDQNEALGGGTERLTSLLLAVGKAFSKGKVEAEEWNMLTERGVNVSALFQKALGKSEQEILAMRTAGELGRVEIEKLLETMGEQNAGAAARNMETLSGLMSNLKDSWEGFLNTIANSGAMDNVRGQLQALAKRIVELQENGRLDEWAKKVSEAMVSLIEGIKTAGSAIYAASGAIELFVKAWAGLKLASLIGGIGSLGRSFLTVLTPGVAASSKAILTLGTAIKGLAWAGLIEATLQVAAAFKVLGIAQDELAESQERADKAQDEATARIEAFREQTGLAASSLDDLIRAQEAGLAVFDAANEQWITGAEAIAEFNEQQESTVETLKEVADTLKTEVQAAVEETNRLFDELTESGEKAGEALENVFKEYDLTVTKDVVSVIAAMADLQEQGKATAEVIEEVLGGALRELSEDELTAFVINARYAFESGKIEAQEFADVIDNAVGSALKNLGVDIELIETGIGELGNNAIDNFKIVRDAISETGDDAELAGKKIVAAFVAAFDEVKTAAGQKQLFAELEQAVKNGTLAYYEYEKAIKKVGEAAGGESATLMRLREEVVKLKEELKSAGQATVEVGKEIGTQANATSGFMGVMIGAVEGWTQKMAELSQGAKEAFTQIAVSAKPAQTETERLNNRIQALGDSLVKLRTDTYRMVDTSGLQGYFGGLRASAAKVEIAFTEQKLAAQQLFAEYESGKKSAESFVVQAERMLKSTNLLDDQDLSNLTRGIDSARKAMERLKDSATDTLTSLQDELDNLQGNVDAVEERQFQARIRDLELKLEEAKFFKNQEAIDALEKSLALANKIYQVEKKNRDGAAAARRTEGVTTTTASRENSRIPSSSNTSNNDRTVTLKLDVGGATSLLSNVDSNEAASLMDKLERGGYLSAG